MPAQPATITMLTDEALLAGLGAGDLVASRGLVRRHQARVYGLALSILADRGAAEDVAQEAFVRAWRHAASYDPRRGTVTAWLLRITRNLAIDALRLRRADVTDPELLAGVAATSQTGEVEQAVILSDSAGQVRAALGSLPVEQSRAVLLAAYYGHTAEEISRSEQIPLGTAKTRIRRGLRKLKEQLTAESVAVSR